MRDDEFEWDDAKAAGNFAKHGIRFDSARRVFADAQALEQIDSREEYGEERSLIIGMSSGRLLAVVFIMRDGLIRIVSARGAEPDEQDDYFLQNG